MDGWNLFRPEALSLMEIAAISSVLFWWELGRLSHNNISGVAGKTECGLRWTSTRRTYPICHHQDHQNPPLEPLIHLYINQKIVWRLVKPSHKLAY